MSDESSATSDAPRAAPGRGRPFDSFDLPPTVAAGIRHAGFTHCTPIQERTLPLALEGRDVAGQAQTGTGKTAAFLVALFTRLVRTAPRPPEPAPRALVVAPTRELVVQIAADAAVLGVDTGLTIHAVFGGIDYHKQRDQLAAGVDVLIGTPGRLIDYLKQRVYSLGAVEVLVIDEADRMFDMGFIRDLRFILRRLPPWDRRQSMLFSATLSWDVMELAHEFMNLPQRIDVAPERLAAENVQHVAYHIARTEKLACLVSLLGEGTLSRVLVFTNMKRTAEDLVAHLQANQVDADAITGDVPQRKRLRLLDDFKEGRLPILVATDVASRGLHIAGVSHVINYDLPQDAEDYVHRVGRTARAGASGHAFSLVGEDDVEALGAIESLLGFKLPFEVPDPTAWATPTFAPRRRRAARGDRAPRGNRPTRRRSGRAGAPAPAASRTSERPRTRTSGPTGDTAGAQPTRRRRRGRRSKPRPPGGGPAGS